MAGSVGDQSIAAERPADNDQIMAGHDLPIALDWVQRPGELALTCGLASNRAFGPLHAAAEGESVGAAELRGDEGDVALGLVLSTGGTRSRR